MKFVFEAKNVSAITIHLRVHRGMNTAKVESGKTIRPRRVNFPRQTSAPLRDRKAGFSRQAGPLEDFTSSSRPANNNASFSFNAPASRVLIYT